MRNITTFDFKELNRYRKIYVLFSGGFDSLYLYEMIKNLFPEKTYPVNCFNPFEQNKTLREIKNKDPNFVEIKPNKKYKYGEILKESFLKLPEAKKLREEGKYHKKIFPCCYYIKHKAFLNDPLFQEEDTVVISGIKRGDGKQRRIWLTLLSQGREKRNQSNGKSTFYHKHVKGQLYCYPFRDYDKYELPKDIKDELWKKYPQLDHSGCQLCPILVLFEIVEEEDRYKKSLQYAKQLRVW